MSSASLRAATAFVERRFWPLPPYRTTLTDKGGRVVDVRYFWRAKTAMNWGFEYNLILKAAEENRTCGE